MNDGTYIATICTPIREATTMLEYLDSELPDLYGEVQLSYVKRSEAWPFTIPCDMFKGGWAYDLKRAKSAV